MTTTLTAKIAILGATLVLAFGAATLPRTAHMAAYGRAITATSMGPGAGYSQARVLQPGSRGSVVEI